MNDKSYTIRVPKRWVRIALIVATTALVVAPLTAIATHSFTDVPNDHTFHGNIEWMKQSEVTKGCNPPANTRYCPEDLVTRGQMAAFIQRFAQYIDAEDGTPARAKLADTVPNGAITGPKIANQAVGTNQIALDAQGVVLAAADVTFAANVPSWFNRFGGQPTVNRPGTGHYEVTFPGLEGELGDLAIVIATVIAPTPGVIAHAIGSSDFVTIRTYDLDGNPRNTSFDLAVIATRSAGAASAAASTSNNNTGD